MLILISAIFLSYAASIIYIYNFRGKERYSHFGEYIRKGWPMFAPFNCFLYLQTYKKARQPIITDEQFAELQTIKDNWQVIRDEAMALYNAEIFDKTTDKNSVGYYDIGFRTFFKRGWSKFYLTWYGYTHASAKRMCPKTVDIVKDLKCVNGAMFSILPPGAELTRHLDPFACSLRYHLGLNTPNSDDCFINVDNNQQSWRDGECFIFDETYIHYAQNNSDENRLILMCDVERPMGIMGTLFNKLYKFAMRWMIVPNTEEDSRGRGNKIFMSLNKLIAKGKELKKKNRPLYKTIKFFLNITLVALLVLILYLPFYVITQLF